MARRPRQTTKGTTVENWIGAARTTPHCGVFERRVEIRVGIWACNNPVWEHQASGARRESEPVILASGLSSLVDEKHQNPLQVRPINGKQPAVPYRR